MDAKSGKAEDQNYSGGGDRCDVNSIPIRTLCVGPIEADMADTIKGYFEQFGAVNSVDIEQDNDSHTDIALVELKLAETAATLLSSKGLHCINGYDVQVKAADPWQQPDHILNALNDHCLRMVLLELDQSDLFNAADVCIRFNQQAKSVFSTKFKKLRLNTIEWSDERMKHLLWTFGSVAQSIDIGSSSFCFMRDRYKSQILAILAQCCTSVLKEITLYGFNFFVKPDDFGIKFDSALKYVEKLVLINFNLHRSVHEFLSVYGELKVLHLERCVLNLNQSTWPKMNKLEELQLDAVFYLNTIDLKGIIEMCPALKKIFIIPKRSGYNINQLDAIRFIVQKLPHLLELEFVGSYQITGLTESMRCLGQLKFLKVLKINLYYDTLALETLIAGLTINAVPIEHLEIRHACISNDAIKDIAQMKQLKALVFFKSQLLTDELMPEFECLGSRLEKLQINGRSFGLACLESD